MATDANSSNLAPVHWEALRYLERANEFSRSSAALTAYLGSTKGTVSQSIKALEQRGLISNKPSAKDKRKNYLSLTRRGKEMLQKDPIAHFTQSIDALPKEDADQFRTSLEKLLLTRLELQGRQPFGLCRNCVYFGKNHEKGAPHFCKLLEERLSEPDSEKICFEQVGG